MPFYGTLIGKGPYGLSIVAITVLYITVNVYNYPRLVVIVTNNLTGLILSRVGHRDLYIYFGNKLSL